MKEGVIGDATSDYGGQVGATQEVREHQVEPGSPLRAVPGGLQGSGAQGPQHQLRRRQGGWKKDGESKARLEKECWSRILAPTSYVGTGWPVRLRTASTTPRPAAAWALPSACLTCPLTDAGLCLEVASPGGNL